MGLASSFLHISSIFVSAFFLVFVSRCMVYILLTSTVLTGYVSSFSVRAVVSPSGSECLGLRLTSTRALKSIDYY